MNLLKIYKVKVAVLFTSILLLVPCPLLLSSCDDWLDVSPSGWDSEMVCYPHVFDHKGKRYMLYNGNGYGRTGFGLAVLEEE